MGRASKSISIIGGADGPTSIFVLGSSRKDKNIIRRIRNYYVKKKLQKKREYAEKSIVSGIHTMEETIQYIKQHYAAVEMNSFYPLYEKRKSAMKYSLIQREKPELIDDNNVLPPDDFNDKQAVMEWHRKIEEWTRECERKIDKIPYDIFPTDYHLFLVNKGEDGKMEIEVDTFYQYISITYSGKKEIMEPIVKDIYLYYGVSQKDIEQKNDRYQTLVAVLSS